MTGRKLLNDFTPYLHKDRTNETRWTHRGPDVLFVSHYDPWTGSW